MAIAFSDTTNKNGVIQRCEILLGLGDTGISGNATLLKQFTALINSAYHKTITMILASQDDWDFDDLGTTDGSTYSYTNYPVATTSLVANQRDYTFPVSLKILKIKRVDVTYDGTTYYRAEPLDSAEISDGLGNDTTTDGRFDKSKPYYDPKANSIWLYPRASAADVTAGGVLRIEFQREISEFTSSDTTKTLGVDVAFQPMVPITASAEWAFANAPSMYVGLKQMEQEYEARLKQYYGRKDDGRILTMKAANLNYE